MVEAKLAAIRDRVEALATETGDFYVVCCRTGERPVPVAGLRFPDRETATEAAQTAVAYRAVLRRYDPEAPVYDFVACQTPHQSGRRDGAVPMDEPVDRQGSQV